MATITPSATANGTPSASSTAVVSVPAIRLIARFRSWHWLIVQTSWPTFRQRGA
jgi:hypothetical protein